MPAETTQVLAEFAAALTYDKIPERVRDYCKDLLLDALACAVAGHQGEETHQLAALSAGLAQSSESSVIGGDRLSLAGATLLNGYLITAVTMCDVHRPTLTHITPEVVPPALAIAERDGLSGRDLLVALAAGCEVTTRIGDRHRLPAVPRPRLARPRRLRSVRRGGGGRTAAAASMPRPWRARSASPAARPPAPSRPGARRPSSSTSAAARCRA